MSKKKSKKTATNKPAAPQTKVRKPRAKKGASRDVALQSLRAESDRALIEQIRRLQALPMNERTHFLRVRHPNGGSHL